MTLEELKENAARLYMASSDATQSFHDITRRLKSDALTTAERKALEAMALVHDCRARRHLQWAQLLESAAHEIENP